MARNRLIVFIGKPGACKSTLIANIFSSYKFVDVLPFVKFFETNGVIPEEKTLIAYHKMYQSIDKIKDQNVVLEIGTNYPELNVSNLEKLQQEYDIFLFLCEASKETCRARVDQRVGDFNPEALDRRLARDFPKSHLAILKKADLSYTILNMEEPMENNIKIIKNKIF
jgi:dephospho-CoA kinase